MTPDAKQQIVLDLAAKAADDVGRVLSTTLDLATEIGGPSAMLIIFAAAIRMLLRGASLAYYNLNTGEPPTLEMPLSDERLALALSFTGWAATGSTAENQAAIERQFKAITGKDMPVPDSWREAIKG